MSSLWSVALMIDYKKQVKNVYFMTYETRIKEGQLEHELPY